MKPFGIWIKRAIVIMIVSILGVFSAPVVEASASMIPNTTPTPAPSQVSGGRLPLAWTREQRIDARLSTFFDRVDRRISRGQALLDRAQADGKDVSGIQTALNAFSQAANQARTIYDGTKVIFSAHAGFDQNGNVTDRASALHTVRDLADQFKQIHQILYTPRHNLRQAIQSFRGTNGPAPIPTQPGA